MERRSFLKQASAGIAAGAAAAPALAADLPTIKWRCASGFPKTLDAIFGATETVAKRVAAATGGKFQISLFAAGEIVPTPGVLDAVKDGKLVVSKTPNGENPLVHGATPILGVDVWEHSYYIDYRHDRHR